MVNNKAVALTGGSCCVLPVALDLQEDGVGVIGKQETSDQAEHLRKRQISFNIRAKIRFKI